jgi:hypothetical protein
MQGGVAQLVQSKVLSCTKSATPGDINEHENFSVMDKVQCAADQNQSE